MTGKPIVYHEVPDRFFFTMKMAAKFLGISLDTLREDTDKGLIPCYKYHGRRTYKLTDLENLVATVPRWHNEHRPIPASSEKDQ